MTIPQLDPGDAATSRRRPALAGAMVGMLALAGAVVGVGAVAGAQDDPDVEPSAASETSSIRSGLITLDGPDGIDDSFSDFEACLDDALAAIDVDGADGQAIDDDAIDEAFEQAIAGCEDLLPDEVLADIEAFEPFDACLDEQLGQNDALEQLETDGDEATDAEWDALEAAFAAAEDSCADLLPDDIGAQMAAWEAFDECLVEADGFEGLDAVETGPVVHVDTGDGFQVVEFGGTVGSVTVSGTAEAVTVATEGGVTVVDQAALDAQWAELDAAHEACEALLPAGVVGAGVFVDEITPADD